MGGSKTDIQILCTGSRVQDSVTSEETVVVERGSRGVTEVHPCGNLAVGVDKADT